MNRRDFFAAAAIVLPAGTMLSSRFPVGHRSEKIMPAELQPELGLSEFYGGTSSGGLANRQSVPIIHCTDLFHPPDDPDDHVDLATLFALPELDIRAIILDLGHFRRQSQATFRSGR